MCLFHNSETYFLTLNPFFIYPEEGQLDRALFHTYLYKIEENNEPGPVSYIGVTDAYKYTQSFISRYLEALSIFKCLKFESEWQNSVIFYDILRMYLELIGWGKDCKDADGNYDYRKVRATTHISRGFSY